MHFTTFVNILPDRPIKDGDILDFQKGGILEKGGGAKGGYDPPPPPIPLTNYDILTKNLQEMETHPVLILQFLRNVYNK